MPRSCVLACNTIVGSASSRVLCSCAPPSLLSSHPLLRYHCWRCHRHRHYQRRHLQHHHCPSPPSPPRPSPLVVTTAIALTPAIAAALGTRERTPAGDDEQSPRDDNHILSRASAYVRVQSIACIYMYIHVNTSTARAQPSGSLCNGCRSRSALCTHGCAHRQANWKSARHSRLSS